MRDRDQLVKRATELGYKFERTGKHSEIYRHGVTGKTVAVAKTPSDFRSIRNSLAEMERNAVTNGTGHLRLADGVTTELGTRDSVVAALKASVMVPLSMSEIIDIVMKSHRTTTANSIRTTTSTLVNSKDPHGVVRLGVGWYVYDPALAGLPQVQRDIAIDAINRVGPRHAYREPTVRMEIIERAEASLPPALHVGLRGQPPPPDLGPAEPATEPGKDAVMHRIFELVAEEPSDGGVAVLRDHDGHLWIARRAREAGLGR